MAAVDKKHHVAWADRIGLNKQWARDIEACSDAFGTHSYPVMVRRFQNNIPNIKGGPQLRDMIEEEEKRLEEKKKYLFTVWANMYPQYADNESYVRQKEEELDLQMAEEKYRFIIQMLEDNDFGFYKSTVEEDEIE